MKIENEKLLLDGKSYVLIEDILIALNENAPCVTAYENGILSTTSYHIDSILCNKEIADFFLNQHGIEIKSPSYKSAEQKQLEFGLHMLEKEKKHLKHVEMIAKSELQNANGNYDKIFDAEASDIDLLKVMKLSAKKQPFLISIPKDEKAMGVVSKVSEITHQLALEALKDDEVDSVTIVYIKSK